MSDAAFALGIWALLTEPSHANRILTLVATCLRCQNPHAPLTLDTLNATLKGSVRACTDSLPDIVAIEATEIAARALPTIHRGETPDAYAMRVLYAARGI
ncbi:hypothetical protein CP967_08540 [Streptomyces nitrosporeus]|uniref:Uncharacterized protein n=1 Tax=Streptomyces nitrosporeus TaxID=28894 RepID=A0A5J6F6Q9_9ACTN|nr:hypothetical protein [Streptomyces nitrosporeus]QEU72009.1 hypothetical protein CP967_08540 [Streptomyces nitrosporeus]GGY81293.1 hypothetical protein GCM10010327_09930 [Streptomyces nitrosporeus]